MAISASSLLDKNGSADLLGALASGLCLIHCLATPFLFLAHAGMADHHSHGHHEAAPLWWSLVDVAFLIVSFLAIRYSAQRTSLKWMPFALYFCWGILAAYILIETFHLMHLSHGLIYLPAFGLVFLHLHNRWHCRCEDDEHRATD